MWAYHFKNNKMPYKLVSLAA